MEILDALAKVTPRAKDSSETFLQRESKSLPSGTTLILVASQIPESFLGLLRDLKERGAKLLVLRIGNQKGSGLEGMIPSCPIRHPGDLLGINSEVQA
jgi:hypothetical protein